jgi:hypothetical protein
MPSNFTLMKPNSLCRWGSITKWRRCSRRLSSRVTSSSQERPGSWRLISSSRRGSCSYPRKRSAPIAVSALTRPPQVAALRCRVDVITRGPLKTTNTKCALASLAMQRLGVISWGL